MAKFRKIWMKVLTALTAIAMGFTACPALAATQFTGETTSALNVRTAPSSKSTRFKKLAKGEKIKIVAKVSKGNQVNGTTADMNYYKLSTGGYVAAQYVKVTGTIVTDEAPPANADETSSEEAEEETTDLSDLEADAEDEDTDDEDDDSDMDDENDGDSEDGGSDIAIVESDGSEVDPDTVDTSAESSSESTSTTIDTSKLSASKMQAKSSVNVRKSPSTKAAVASKLNGGDIVTTIAAYQSGDTYQDETISGSWMQLNSGGFVSSDYLQAAEMKSGGTTSKTSTSSKKVTKTTATAKSNVTLYSSPNKLATKKGTMKKGSSQQVTGTYSSGSTYKSWKVSGAWYKLSNGSFVQAGSVSVKSSSSTVTSTSTSKVPTTSSISAADYFKAGDGIRMRKNVNMRKGPGTSYAVIRLMQGGETAVIDTVVKSGSTVDGKKVSDTWVKLVGESGYVHADYIEFDADKTVAFVAESASDGGTSDNSNSEQKTQEELEAGLVEE